MLHEAATRDELMTALEIMKAAYEASALEYGMTEENCPYRGRTRLPLDVLCAEQDAGYRIFLYEKEGQMAGMLSFRIGEAMEISDLCVRPDFQCQGIGNHMMRFAIGTAKAAGCSSIRLGMIHDNLRLRTWYERWGFRTVRTKRYPAVIYTVGTMELML